MKQHLAVSAIGSDRTGMVHELTRVISDCGGNIAESRMAALGSEFAMLLLVSAATGTRSRASSRSSRASPRARGLSVHLKRTEPQGAAHGHAALLDRHRQPRPDRHRRRAVGVFRHPQHRHRRSLHARLSRGAHRRADVRRADDRQRPEPTSTWRSCARNSWISATPSISTPFSSRSSHERRCRKISAAARRSPDFSLPTTGGGSWQPEGRRRQEAGAVLLPARQHPGCTLEGQHFRDLHAKFRRAGVPVIGISRDSLASHEKFCDKMSLPVRAAVRRGRASLQAVRCDPREEHVRPQSAGHRAQHLPDRRTRACCARNGAR